MAWLRSRKKESGGGTTKSVSYLKWQLKKTRNVPTGSTIQATEFYLYLNGEKHNWDSNIAVTCDISVYSGYEADKLVDGNLNTKFAAIWGSSQTNECNIVFSLGETITLDGNSYYSYVTGNDEVSRDPISWILYGSADGVNWEKLDERTDVNNIPTGRKTEVLLFGFPISACSGGGGETKKKNFVISRDINASTLSEIVIDEDDVINIVCAADHTSYATAYETDLIKFFYDVPGDYHQYYWHVIAVTDVVYNSTNYSAGDIIDYWYYNVTKEMLVEEA